MERIQLFAMLQEGSANADINQIGAVILIGLVLFILIVWLCSGK